MSVLELTTRPRYVGRALGQGCVLLGSGLAPGGNLHWLLFRSSLLESAEDLDAECLMKKVFREGEEVNAVVWQVSSMSSHMMWQSPHVTPTSADSGFGEGTERAPHTSC